jgi:uncharacterized protein
MSKEFAARRLDVKGFAEEGASLQGEEPLRDHARLLAETDGRGASSAVTWSVTGELRNPRHVHPEIWLHLQAQSLLPLTCQRCLGPVEVSVAVDRAFRFVPDEDMAAAQDEEAEEDVLALSRTFDLLELIEDELLMELPLAPRHETCPVSVTMAVADEDFEKAATQRENPFAVLGQLKSGSKSGKP